MYSIEDVNSRTILQQFHALYENQKETNETVEDIESDLAQEIQDRTNADLDLAEDIQSLQNQLDSLGTIFTLKGSVATVGDLPEENNHVGDVYYVVSESTGYIWIDDNGTERWEQLGISVDLSNYVTNDDLSTALADKQNKLTAGTNISIIGDTISATQPDTTKFEMLSGVSAPSTVTVGAVGQKYLDTTKNDVYICTAITDNGDDTFSYTWLLTGGNGKQNKLTAGTNISINGDVISASGGGGQLYRHYIQLDYGRYILEIINTSNTPFNSTTFKEWLTANGFTSSSSKYINLIKSGSYDLMIESGKLYDHTEIGIFTQSNYIYAYYIKYEVIYNSDTNTFSRSGAITTQTDADFYSDTVTQI